MISIVQNKVYLSQGAHLWHQGVELCHHRRPPRHQALQLLPLGLQLLTTLTDLGYHLRAVVLLGCTLGEEHALTLVKVTQQTKLLSGARAKATGK